MSVRKANHDGTGVVEEPTGWQVKNMYSFPPWLGEARKKAHSHSTNTLSTHTDTLSRAVDHFFPNGVIHVVSDHLLSTNLQAVVNTLSPPPLPSLPFPSSDK